MQTESQVYAIMPGESWSHACTRQLIKMWKGEGIRRELEGSKRNIDVFREIDSSVQTFI